MKEYKVVTVKSVWSGLLTSSKPSAKKLNKLASQGWELTETISNKGSTEALIFERETDEKPSLTERLARLESE